MNKDFVNRLREAFDNATMAEIARRLGVPHATIRNYFGGRLPAPEVLIKIARQTSVSLNWLLTGAGEKFVGNSRPPDLLTIFEQKIGQIVDAKLAERLDNGLRESSNPFDIEESIRRYDDPQRVMNDWFSHDGRGDYPQDFGVVFFQGWESFSDAEKIDAVRDARKVLERTLRSRP